MTDRRYAEKAFMLVASFLLWVFSCLFAYGWTHVQQFTSEDKGYSKVERRSYVTSSNVQPANLLLLEPAEYLVECLNYEVPGMSGHSAQLSSWTLSNPPP